MSALPPKADIRHCDRHVRFVPEADMERFLLAYQNIQRTHGAGDVHRLNRQLFTARSKNVRAF